MSVQFATQSHQQQHPLHSPTRPTTTTSPSSLQLQPLTTEDQKSLKHIIHLVDKQKQGVIAVYHLVMVLEMMQTYPTTADVQQITQYLGVGNGTQQSHSQGNTSATTLSFDQVTKALQMQRAMESVRLHSSSDLQAAFNAVANLSQPKTTDNGSQPSGTEQPQQQPSSISVEKLKHILRDNYGLTLKFDSEELEEKLQYGEFERLFA